MQIPISKIGPIQKQDIEKSTGIVYYNDIARICTVVKDQKSHDDRGDKSPFYMSKLFGKHWKSYNNHFIVQVAGCPLKCWYCYVDNLKTDLYMTPEELVNIFIKFRNNVKKKFNVDLNVFHFMGGDPGLYCEAWLEIRKVLDLSGLNDIILFSDVVFVENYFIKKKPWEYLNKINNFILTGCLKGTNRENFLINTGLDLYEQAIKELKNYINYENFYLTLINYDTRTLENIYKIIDKERVNLLNVINYEVTKKRKRR